MSKIAADQQRCGQKTPQADMCILLIRCKLGVVLGGTPADAANDEHIGVVEMTWFRERRQLILVKPKIAHAFPAVVDIPRGSPALAAHSRPPGPHVAHPILAKTKDDIPRNTIEGGAHHDIRLLQSVETRFETGKIAVRTKVIFQIVDTPVTIGPRILQLMLP